MGADRSRQFRTGLRVSVPPSLRVRSVWGASHTESQRHGDTEARIRYKDYSRKIVRISIQRVTQ
jgi:hypothetical protein